jgi:hypothetical protein
MSFKRLDPEDFLISAESITAGAWTGNSATLTQFFTDATQLSSDSEKYYRTIYNSTATTKQPQFNIAYGDSVGSGSAYYNPNIPGKTPTATVYGQFQNIVLGDENTNFNFGGSTHDTFLALTIERARFKGNMLPGTMTLVLSSGSQPAAGNYLTLTDNSLIASSVTFNEAGRVFQLISGSAGAANTGLNVNGYHPTSGSYGLFLPDIGTLLLNVKALETSFANGGCNFPLLRNPDTDDNNPAQLFTAISGGGNFTLNSQENLSSDYVFIRARNSEFNYSANPSFASGSVGDVTFPEFINSPQTFITTVGLYNDSNELLATAKLSKPLKKDFTKEALIRVKLDF